MKRCCCCCSLRRGSYTIAILTQVLGLAGVLYGVYCGVRGQQEGWVMTGVGGANVLLAIMLTYGVKLEVRVILKAWVVLTTLLVVLGGGLGVVYIVLSSFLVGLIVLCFSILQLYFAMVVWFFSISLDETIAIE